MQTTDATRHLLHWGGPSDWVAAPWARQPADPWMQVPEQATTRLGGLHQTMANATEPGPQSSGTQGRAGPIKTLEDSSSDSR